MMWLIVVLLLVIIACLRPNVFGVFGLVVLILAVWIAARGANRQDDPRPEGALKAGGSSSSLGAAGRPFWGMGG
jgi:hypothetical protein